MVALTSSQYRGGKGIPSSPSQYRSKNVHCIISLNVSSISHNKSDKSSVTDYHNYVTRRSYKEKRGKAVWQRACFLYCLQLQIR